MWAFKDARGGRRGYISSECKAFDVGEGSGGGLSDQFECRAIYSNIAA